MWNVVRVVRGWEWKLYGPDQARCRPGRSLQWGWAGAIGLLLVGEVAAQPASEAAPKVTQQDVDACLLERVKSGARDVSLAQLREACAPALIAAERRARSAASRPATEQARPAAEQARPAAAPERAPEARAPLLDQVREAAHAGPEGVADLARERLGAAAEQLSGAVRIGAPAPVASIDEGSLITRRATLERSYWTDRLGLMPYRPSLFMPLAYTPDQPGNPSGGKPARVETRIQLSFKVPINEPPRPNRASWIPTAWFAYTFQAWWKAYQVSTSHPFREYNHEPELFLDWPLNLWIGRAHVGVFRLGFNHHSNGREALGSRSWNRIVAELQADNGPWWMSVRPWYRLPEKPETDDNPDIVQRYGAVEWKVGYVSEPLNATLTARTDFRAGKGGSWQLDLTVPSVINPRVRWVLQAFNGYGESLVDYDRPVRRYSLGLMFNDWF